MNTLLRTFSAVALAAACGGAVAAQPMSDAAQRYRQDRAACLSGQSHQDRATCLKEAGAALAEARRGRLSNHQQQQWDENASARCDRLPTDLKADCEARMDGEGTTSGSVESGGIYRELVTREVMPPDSASPTR